MHSTRVRVRGLAADIRTGTRWVYSGSDLGRLAVATHVWFAAQAVLLVVVPPYAFLQLQLSPFQLGLVFAVAGLGALLGAVASTPVGDRLGTGGAIICSYAISSVGVVIMLAAALPPTGWAAAAVLAAGQFCHGWAMGVSNSHEMSYRQALTPDALQARTNTTMRSLNRAVLVIVSPISGLVAGWFGFGLALIAATVVFAASALILTLSPFGAPESVTSESATPLSSGISARRLAARREWVEAMLDQPADRPQASQRPPCTDHVDVDVGAVTDYDVVKALLVTERQAGEVVQGIASARLGPVDHAGYLVTVDESG